MDTPDTSTSPEPGPFDAAADRVRGERDLQVGVASEVNTVYESLEVELIGFGTGRYRPRGVVPVAVAGFVLGVAVALAAAGMARDALEARLAAWEARRAARSTR